MRIDESREMDPASRRTFSKLRRSALMVGEMKLWPGATAPTGWAFCDGAAVSRTVNADLFTLIGTTFGAGDGSTTFNLPDMRGRAPIGVGTGSGLTARALAAQVGVEAVTLTAAQSGLPLHNHGNTGTVSADHTHTYSGTTGVENQVFTMSRAVGDSGFMYVNTTATTFALGNGGTIVANATFSASTGGQNNNHNHNFSGTTSGISTNHVHGTGDAGPAGASASTGIMQPSLAVNFIIRLS